MQRLVGVVFAVGVIMAGIFTMHRVLDVPLEQQEQLASIQMQAEIERLRLLQEREKQQTAVIMARLRKEEAAAEQQARIEAAESVVKARVVARMLAALWLPVSLLGAAAVGVGFLCYVAVKPRPFRFNGLETSISRREASRLAEKSLFVSGLSEAAKVAAYREEIYARRFAQNVSLISALKSAWKGVDGVLTQAALPEAHTDDPAQAFLPSFHEILASREIHGELILGYAQDGDPITGHFDAVHSCLIYGLAGSGKTSWLRGLLAQTIRTEPETQIYALDPHRHRKDSLLGSLPTLANLRIMDEENPHHDFLAIESELNRRISSKKDNFAPCIFLIDELPTLAKRPYEKELKCLCESVAQQGRKVNVFLLASAQDLREKKIGDFRASLSSAYFFKGKSSQVKAFLGNDIDAEKQFRQIHKPGAALFSPTNDETRIVSIPECKIEDLSLLTVTASKNDASLDDGDRAASVTPICHSDNVTKDRDRPENQGVTDSDNTLDTLRNLLQNGKKITEIARVTGLDRSLLTNIVNGKRRPSKDVRAKLMSFLTSQQTA